MFNSTSVEMMTTLVGTHVKVNLGGPESKAGVLLAVESDYLVLYSDQREVIYYQLTHVKAISINPQNTSGRLSHNISFISTSSFQKVLQKLIHKKVKVNRGGPDSVEAVLNNTFDSYVELTGQNDVLFISIHHIKSISHVAKVSGKSRSTGKKSSKQTSKKQTSKKQTSNKQSTGRQTSGSRSKRRSSGNSVKAAMLLAAKAGATSFMQNDPEGNNQRSSKSHRTSRSHCSSCKTSGKSHCTSGKSHRSSQSHRSSRSHCLSKSNRSRMGPLSRKRAQNVKTRTARPMGKYFRV